jgi:small subunit ribosomal protein S19e
MRYDVDPRAFNRELARELKERKLVTPPDWAPFVKTGSHVERVPQEPDWWYQRAASIMRTVSLKGPIGTAKMAVLYGGRKNRGVAPDKFREAGTNIIRKCLQQLERSRLLKQVTIKSHRGRVITKEGAAILKAAAGRVSKDEIKHVFHERVQKERPSAMSSPATAPRPPKSKEAVQ